MSTAYLNRTDTVRSDLDTLTQVPYVMVAGRNLKSGMVLVDDLDCPAAELDNRAETVRRSGCVRFLVHMFDARTIETMSFHEHTEFKVMAR